jgi:type IV pilus assembly protein PilQ
MARAVSSDRHAPGGRLSIDFHDADLRTVIDLIAAVGGYDVVFAPEVQGRLSVKIDDRPGEEALGTILQEKHLRATLREDWIDISPADSTDGGSPDPRP